MKYFNSLFLILLFSVLTGCQKHQPSPVGSILKIMMEGEKEKVERPEVSESDEKLIEKATEKEWEEVDKELDK